MDLWKAIKEEPPLCGSRGLWITVLIAAIEDFLKGDRNARAFLFEPNETFTLAAGSVGMEDVYLRKLIRNLYRNKKGNDEAAKILRT